MYNAITGVAPPSERILQDVDGVWKAFKIVGEAKGVYDQGLAEKTGRRYMKSKTKMGHGGSRTAKDPSLAYLKRTTMMHPDLKALMKEAREFDQREFDRMKDAADDIAEPARVGLPGMLRAELTLDGTEADGAEAVL